jgi:hypothetical protein
MELQFLQRRSIAVFTNLRVVGGVFRTLGREFVSLGVSYQIASTIRKACLPDVTCRSDGL